MLLYFNGDSFVAGTELADDMLPGYPGYVTWPLDFSKDSQFSKGKVWLDASHDPKHPSNKHRMDVIHDLTQLELARAYPNKVHGMTGLPFINRGQGGSSMDRIVRITLTDLIRLRKENPDEKLIAFIGTTYPERSEIPNNKKEVFTDMHGFPQDWASISVRFRQTDFDDLIENVRRYRVLYETSYHSLVNFYKNVITLQDFCSNNNICLHWIATGENVINRKIEDEYNDRIDLQMLIDYAKFNYSIDMTKIVAEYPGEKVVCPGGHFGELIHQRTAEEIVRIINEL